MEKQPIIGLVPLIDTGRESYWMLPGYMAGLRQAGGLPIMLPLTDDAAQIRQLVSLCDGLLFTGGHDLSPALYGQEPLPELGECVPARDAMEMALLREALVQDKAVFGICRGIQLLNTALGGTLYQDIPTQFPSTVNHRQSAPYHQPIHDVSLKEGSPMEVLLGQNAIRVNSCHHQGIRRLSPQLEIMGTAPDGLVEAVCMPDRRFVWAVQWHPEFAYKADETSRQLFRAFVRGAGRKG